MYNVGIESVTACSLPVANCTFFDECAKEKFIFLYAQNGIRNACSAMSDIERSENMYKKGDTVLHPTAGVCTVTNIKTEDFASLGKRDFYVLTPVYDSRQVIHTPVESEKITLKKVLGKKEIISVIKSVTVDTSLWCENDSERKDIFRKILKNGDRCEIIKLIITICEKRKEKEAAGKKLHLADERILNEAQKIIHQEFAYSLKIPTDEIAPFIMKELGC